MYFLLINGLMVIPSVLVPGSVNTQHHRPEEYWAFTKEIYSDWRGERGEGEGILINQMMC